MNALLLQACTITAPDIFLLGMVCVMILADVFLSERYRHITYYLAQFTLIVAFFLSLPLLQSNHGTVLVWSGQYVADTLAGLSKLGIYLFSFFAFAYARESSHTPEVENLHPPAPELCHSRESGNLHPPAQPAYYLLGLLAVLGMSVMASANTFLTIYLGLELLSLSLYAMIAMQKKSHVAVEAAMKYFVLGSMASALLLYGISMVFGLTGSIQMNVIAHAIEGKQNLALLIALVFVLVGILFKFGAFPFHMWVPDIYEGAFTPTTLFVASAPKVATFAVLLRILLDAMPTLHITWTPILVVISVLSMFFGNLLAIVQTNLKRLLAYSSIAHVGYMLLGFIAGPVILSGYQAAFFYILTYALVAVGTFAVITIMSEQGVECDRLTDYRGLNARHPWLAFMMLILLFSLAGIPPTVGFIAKFSLLQALVDAGWVKLALLALFFALIGAYYYLRVVMLMYFEEPEPLSDRKLQLSWSMTLAISLNGGAALLLGLLPSALIELCKF